MWQKTYVHIVAKFAPSISLNDSSVISTPDYMNEIYWVVKHIDSRKLLPQLSCTNKKTVWATSYNKYQWVSLGVILSFGHFQCAESTCEIIQVKETEGSNVSPDIQNKVFVNKWRSISVVSVINLLCPFTIPFLLSTNFMVTSAFELWLEVT